MTSCADIAKKSTMDCTKAGKLLTLFKQHPQGLSIGKIQDLLPCSAAEGEAGLRELKRCGYPLTPTSDGYKLEPAGDLLLPYEFPGYEHLVHFQTETASTMEWARELANEGSPAGTIAMAEIQTRGKGRLSRIWDSAAGGLYFTLLLRPEISPNQAYLYNFAAAIALAQTFRERYALMATIKWPNDILIYQKKISGILLEMHATLTRIHYLNIGIGINVNNTLTSELPQATTLAEQSGQAQPRSRILLDFLNHFYTLQKNFSVERIVEKYKNLCTTLGRQVSVTLKNSKIITGLARDLNQEGALELVDSAGNLQTIHYGDCSHL